MKRTKHTKKAFSLLILNKFLSMFYHHVGVELKLLPFWCLENKICITGSMSGGRDVAKLRVKMVVVGGQRLDSLIASSWVLLTLKFNNFKTQAQKYCKDPDEFREETTQGSYQCCLLFSEDCVSSERG